MTFQSEDDRRDDSSWIRVGDQPERWERPGFGTIIAKGTHLWAFLPICRHDYYPALSLADARALARARSGLCAVCWQQGVTGASRSLNGGAWLPPSEALRPQPVAQRPPRVVLLVEDDIDTRESVGELLEDHGYSVVGAGNGAEAVDVLQSGTIPSVIVLDLMMPVMDGYRFRARQRSDPALAAIPVIVITAGAAPELDELNASAVMRKPLHVPRLLATIHEHCSC